MSEIDVTAESLPDLTVHDDTHAPDRRLIRQNRAYQGIESEHLVVTSGVPAIREGRSPEIDHG